MGKIYKIRLLINYYIRSIAETLEMNNLSGEKVIILNIQYPLKFRFFYWLVYLFDKLGYKVYIYLPTPRHIINITRMGGSLDLLPPVRLIRKLPKWSPQAIYCTDHQDGFWDGDWIKKFFLEFDLQKASGDVINPLYIPFSVHDYIHRCFWKDREALLKNPKNIRMLFSGAYQGYRGSGISKVLGKIEREEIVEIYRAHPKTQVISSQGQLDTILSAPASDVYYLVDHDHFRIPPERWLEVLSHVEVFLCPPGIVNPMSYNANEAIAMGAVPLINYPEWFHPHLEDHKNSLVFSNKDELVSHLDQISGYREQELSSLREGVNKYFELHQSEIAFINKVRELDKSKTITFIMNVEQSIQGGLNPESIAVSSG